VRGLPSLANGAGLPLIYLYLEERGSAMLRKKIIKEIGRLWTLFSYNPVPQGFVGSNPTSRIPKI